MINMVRAFQAQLSNCLISCTDSECWNNRTCTQPCLFCNASNGITESGFMDVIKDITKPNKLRNYVCSAHCLFVNKTTGNRPGWRFFRLSPPRNGEHNIGLFANCPLVPNTSLFTLWWWHHIWHWNHHFSGNPIPPRPSSRRVHRRVLVCGRICMVSR